MHQTRVGMWLIVCLWAMRGVAAAQVGGGRITGIVTDQAGAAVPGATVTSTNRQTGAIRTTVSSSSGLYALPGLRPGEYNIAVELRGFRSARQDGIRVETGLIRQLDVSLAVGGVAETVTVAGDASALRATASLGHVVSEEKIPALPLNGRSFITLAQMAPAVALPPGSQCRASMADGLAPTNTCSTASRCCSPSLDR